MELKFNITTDAPLKMGDKFWLVQHYTEYKTSHYNNCKYCGGTGKLELKNGGKLNCTCGRRKGFNKCTVLESPFEVQEIIMSITKVGNPTIKGYLGYDGNIEVNIFNNNTGLCNHQYLVFTSEEEAHIWCKNESAKETIEDECPF